MPPGGPACRVLELLAYRDQMTPLKIGILGAARIADDGIVDPSRVLGLADTLHTGAEFLIDVDDSVANAELIDEVYRKAGLSPRG
jgi:hypothetical protein